MCNTVGYSKYIFSLKEKILNEQNIDTDTANEYIKELNSFNEEINGENRLELYSTIELLKLYLNLIIKIKKENTEIIKKLEEQKMQLEIFTKGLKTNKNKLKKYNQDILTMMGIFLSIFSIIGINISFFSNLENMDVLKIILLAFIINIILVTSIKIIFYEIKKF